MADAPSSRDISDLCPAMQELAQKFLDLTSDIEDGTFITETFRNEADQNADWQKGRDAEGNIVGEIITNARFGQSPHNCLASDGVTPSARAFDFGIKLGENELDWDASDPAWQRAISVVENLGMTSGSEFHSPKDSPHAELINWNTAS